MKRSISALLTLSWLVGIVSAREVQSHGVLFEKWLRDAFFGGYTPRSYTQKWDIPATANTKHGGIPVNPKATKHGAPIGFGDALRQFDVNEPFLLIVGFWRQESGEKKTWVNVQTVRVEPAHWRYLWQPITRADLEALDAIIKDQALSLEEARKKAQEAKGKPPFTEALMQVNPKIDANQRRLQCSLRFADFFAQLAPAASPAPQERPQVFGIPVPRAFESVPRVIVRP